MEPAPVGKTFRSRTAVGVASLFVTSTLFYIALIGCLWNFSDAGAAIGIHRRLQNTYNSYYGSTVTGAPRRVEEDCVVDEADAIRREMPHCADQTEDDYAWTRWIGPVVQLFVFFIICVWGVIGTGCHWACYIKPTPEKYIPQNAVIPADLKGKWAYGVFECFGACGTFCCFLWCPSCAVSDLWYRAGWLHQMMGGSAENSSMSSCPGWQFVLGVGLHLFVQELAGCFVCCLWSVGRGGMRWIDGSTGGTSGIDDHRLRFALPHDGFITFCCDSFLWACCGACVGTQEYRQIMAVLERGPVQVQDPAITGTVIIGAPVMVVGEPMAVDKGSNEPVK